MSLKEDDWDVLRRHGIAMDRAWQSSSIRRRFEKEQGFEPLYDDTVRRAAQADSGYVIAYEEGFRVWAAAEFGIALP